jgi:hypothetical protein
MKKRKVYRLRLSTCFFGKLYFALVCNIYCLYKSWQSYFPTGIIAGIELLTLVPNKKKECRLYSMYQTNIFIYHCVRDQFF